MNLTMANSKLKLIYFDGKGRGEGARLVLQAAGKEFEDVRLPEEDWPQHKHIAPFGQAPVLEVDGVVYAQSLAIKTFLAREFKLYGNTNLESLQIDQINHLIEDLVTASVGFFHLNDEAEKKKFRDRIKTEVSPTFLGHLERLLKENGTGYFVGSRLTLADISVLDVATGMLENFVVIDGRYPNLQENLRKVKAHSKIGPYLASRPVTPW